MDKLLLIEILLPRSLAGTRVASAGAGDPVAIFPRMRLRFKGAAAPSAATLCALASVCAVSRASPANELAQAGSFCCGLGPVKESCGRNVAECKCV